MIKNIFRMAIGGALAALSLASFVYQARGQEFKTIEARGAQRLYSSRTTSRSSHTVSGILLSYSVAATGGSITFVIKHSTVTGGDQNVNVSSSVYVSTGAAVGDRAYGVMVNPLILITSLDAAATAYIDISYFAPRAPGGF